MTILTSRQKGKQTHFFKFTLIVVDGSPEKSNLTIEMASLAIGSITLDTLRMSSSVN